MGQFIKFVSTDELTEGMGKLIEIEEKQIALFNVGGDFYALENACTHRGGPLAEGKINGEVVTCPWHGAQFNIKTGEVLRPPAPISVTGYNVRIVGTDVEIEV